MYMHSQSLWSCPTLCDPMDLSLQCSSVQGAGVQLQQPGIQPEGVSGVGKRETEAVSQFFFGLPVYFKLMILFYSFLKALGQRFDIFSSH